jgi:hypothetical protein
MIDCAKVQTWSMLLETGLIGKILERTGRRYRPLRKRRRREREERTRGENAK